MDWTGVKVSHCTMGEGCITKNDGHYVYVRFENDAEEKIIPNINKLEKAALKTIRENGFDYNVNIYVAKEFFKTRRIKECAANLMLNV